MEPVSLLDALTRPAAFPYPVEQVELRQTHISLVFLAGTHVYKVKKSVNLGFVDFSTLEKRRHFCEEEVRLNRRLAPDVYLGVVPVVRTEKGLAFEGDGEAVEWAVKMRRLPESATLKEQLLRGDIAPDLAELLARRIAAFHRDAETNERIAAFGRVEGVTHIILDIYARSAQQVGITVSRAVHHRLRELSEQALAELSPLIDSRAARRMPRDTHGDLHLDHIYYFPGKEPPADLIIVDCIEFNERFRFIDPVADMAFPVMDFQFYGRRELAKIFADSYFQASGDEEGRALLPLYIAYRATVRGAVEGLLLTEQEVPADEQAVALENARGHWLLALGELEKPGRKPCLLLVAGLPGTGKSTLSQELAQTADFSVIRSDVVRKELARLTAEDARKPVEDIYTREWHERTYAECLQRAEQLLFEGRRVIVDATFRSETHRQMFLETAQRWRVPGVLLLCTAEPETIRQRLDKRRGDVSDANWRVHVQIAETWEKASPTTQQHIFEIPTGEGHGASLGHALNVLRQQGLQF